MECSVDPFIKEIYARRKTLSLAWPVKKASRKMGKKEPGRHKVSRPFSSSLTIYTWINVLNSYSCRLWILFLNTSCESFTSIKKASLFSTLLLFVIVLKKFIFSQDVVPVSCGAFSTPCFDLVNCIWIRSNSNRYRIICITSSRRILCSRALSCGVRSIYR